MKKFLMLLGILSCLILYSNTSFAQNQPAKNADAKGEAKEEEKLTGDVIKGLYIHTNLGGALNPLGLGLKLDLFYRIPIVDKPGMLWKTTKFDVGIQEFVSPAFSRTSAFFKLEPIAIFDVAVHAGIDYMFGGGNKTFGPGFINYSGYEWDFSDAGRDALFAASNKYAGIPGFRLGVVPTLKAALGPVVVAYSFGIDYGYYQGVVGNYFYDHSTYMLLRTNGDIVFKNDAKLLFKIGPFAKPNQGVGTFMVGANFVHQWVNSSKENNMKLVGMIAWSGKYGDFEPYGVIQIGSYLNDQNNWGIMNNKGKFHFALLLGMTHRLL